MKVFVFLAVLSFSCALDLDHGDIEKVDALGAHNLAKMLRRAVIEPEILAAELRASPLAQLAPAITPNEPKAPQVDAKPIVVTHGMGDSCFNSGMDQITKAAGSHMGVYSVCIPGGPNEVEDTLSGFLVNMDKNVDIFAEKVRSDSKLAGGFDAFGLSQGNAVIRGYIQRYNDPPVRNYLSVHGTIMGVAGFPNCNPSGILHSICDTLDEVLGDMAYAKVVQDVLFQANYFRDPVRLNTSAYQTGSQIAQWNNENPAAVNATYVSNFDSVRSYAMIKALKDTMVFPNEGEWWGEFVDGQFKKVWKMAETPLYKSDAFGLKTADQAKKLHFNTTTGNHLKFTVEELEGWLDLYFK